MRVGARFGSGSRGRWLPFINEWLVLASPFTLHLTGVVAAVLALTLRLGASDLQRTHYRRQRRVLLAAFIWTLAGMALIGAAMHFHGHGRGGLGRMHGWNYFIDRGGQPLLLAGAACLLTGAFWCVLGAIVGLFRQLRGGALPRT